MDDLLETELPKGAGLIAYADDVVLFLKANSRNYIETLFEQRWNMLGTWAKKVKLSFATKLYQSSSRVPLGAET